MRRVLLFTALLFASCSKPAEEALDVAASAIRVDELRRHQTYLASKELEGRKAGSPGGFKAAAYLESECRRMGLKPAGKDGGYFYPFGGEHMKDIIAEWPGSEPEGEWVAVGAHYDHLGEKDGVLYLGADDNGSGTSVVLEIAEAATKRKFRHSIIFFWFDGEERGLLGSKAWMEGPTRQVDRCAAMVNIDMVGRNDPHQLFVCVEKEERTGEPRYPIWAAAIRASESASGLAYDWNGADRLMRRSDNWPFMERGVPAAFFTGNLHADYHQPTDTVDKIDFAKEERVGRALYRLVARCADYAGSFR